MGHPNGYNFVRKTDNLSQVNENTYGTSEMSFVKYFRK